MGALRSHFRPEFLNRLDEIVVLHALDPEHIKRIVTLELGKVTATAAGQGVTLEWDDALIDHLAEAGYLPESGAHELSRLVRNEVESRLAYGSVSVHSWTRRTRPLPFTSMVMKPRAVMRTSTSATS